MVMLTPTAVLTPADGLTPGTLYTPTPPPVDALAYLPPPPLQVFVREPDGTVLGGALMTVVKSDIVLRHLAPGSWALTMLAGSEASLLARPGAGAVFVVNGEPVMSGPMQSMTLESAGGLDEWTFTGSDDSAMLNITGWPVPANALTAQSSITWKSTGDAESVLKSLVSANTSRLSLGLSIATNQSRGGTVTGRARFGLLLEEMRQLGEVGGVGWRILDSGAGPVFDVYEPQDRTSEVLFTPQSGSLRKLTYTRTAPTATRVIVGDSEAATSRKFRQRTNTTAETEWGIIRESFIDQRSTNVNDELDQAGDEHLAENGDKTSVTLDLYDIPGQKYGIHYQVGDVVPALVADGVTITDVVWEVRIGAEGGALKVQPTVGKPDETETTALLRQVGRGLRQIGEAL